MRNTIITTVANPEVFLLGYVNFKYDVIVFFRFLDNFNSKLELQVIPHNQQFMYQTTA